MSTNKPRSGRLFVLSAPSGTGKTTISRRLQEAQLVCLSISHTTRPPRPAEKHGLSYFFVSDDTFSAMRDANYFLEWAEVYGHLYGTSADWVDRVLASGRHVLLEIDCQGAQHIKAKKPETIAIFVRPPDLTTLRSRLLARQSDSQETIERRLKSASEEMAQGKYFDYAIINDDLDEAVTQIQNIINNTNGKETIY